MSNYLTRMIERAAGKEPAVRPLVPVSFALRPDGLEVAEVGHHGGVAERKEGRSRVSKQSETEAALGQLQSEEGINIERTQAESLQALTLPDAILQWKPAVPDSRVTLPVQEEENMPSAAGAVRAPKAATQDASVHQAAATMGAVPLVQAGLPPVPDEAVTPHADADESDVFHEALQQLNRRKTHRTISVNFPDEESVIPPRKVETTGNPAINRPDSSSIFLLQEPADVAQAHGRLSVKAQEKMSVALEEVAPKPPTIKVSIGRVEILASAPAAAPAETQVPSAPKISLDEYLRKQPGGNR